LVQHASRSVNSCESSRLKVIDGLGVTVEVSNEKTEGKRIDFPETGSSFPLFGSKERMLDLFKDVKVREPVRIHRLIRFTGRARQRRLDHCR
jgi:hypothetical protein